jgi:hypothetical protein
MIYYGCHLLLKQEFQRGPIHLDEQILLWELTFCFIKNDIASRG